MSFQSKYRLEIAPIAQSDIIDILQYTHENYGKRQRKNYSDAIRKALKTIQEVPYLGHARNDIGENYKAWNVNKHTIIYAIEGNIISIFRVLHSRMDFPEYIVI
ncbi:MAG: type II toxin-antitoxin system RelE/ParE family toxin [Rickettsiales bacterium]